MPRDVSVLRAVREYRRRFRVAELGVVAVASAALAGVVLASVWVVGASPGTTRVSAVAAFAVCAAALGLRSWRRWTTARVAAAVESRYQGLDNLVVTAEELASGRSPAVHPAIEAEVAAAARARLATLSPSRVQPLGRALGLGVSAVLALSALLAGLPSVRALGVSGSHYVDEPGETAVLAAGDVRVVITPPAYARRDAVTLTNPSTVAALEGSRIHLQASSAGRAALVNLDGTLTPFTPDGAHHALTVSAVESRPLLVRFESPSGGSADRLVSLRVHPDERPSVRIEQPAKDLMFPDSSGQVAVTIAARDDVGLSSLALRYTRVSGSGETFTFEEGEWPIRIARGGASDWTGRAELSLAALKLEEGDTLVYRAVARDGKPGADPSLSDSFLIEVGRMAGVASTGFALPDERDRHGLSQQMLIIKTERLHADRATLSEEAVIEQARLLAIEQRMVKAEFEFMTGGVVEDEVEEAAHSHELAEGRLENTGQAELITAIREMSRAEARLNTADTAQALISERAALRALQRAFDRRRYLLRTLPERARIDLSRRLSGDLDMARSSAQPASDTSTDPFLDSAREVLRELEAVKTGPINAPGLASRVLALEPGSEALQNAALQLAGARDTAALNDAVRDAQRMVAAAMAARLAKAVPMPINRDALVGRLVQELSPGGAPR